MSSADYLHAEYQHLHMFAAPREDLLTREMSFFDAKPEYDAGGKTADPYCKVLPATTSVVLFVFALMMPARTVSGLGFMAGTLNENPKQDPERKPYNPKNRQALQVSHLLRNHKSQTHHMMNLCMSVPWSAGFTIR